MKINPVIILFSLLLSSACEEKTGVCIGCCDSNGNKVCKSDFTDEMCADYNKNRTNGLDWTFHEGSAQCLPQTPSKP